jgi:hypothetical protein
MWLPATGGSAIAPYLPADVASGCPPGADWGKGMGKSEEPDQATAVSWLHFFGFFLVDMCSNMFKQIIQS